MVLMGSPEAIRAGVYARSPGCLPPQDCRALLSRHLPTFVLPGTAHWNTQMRVRLWSGGKVTRPYACPCLLVHVVEHPEAAGLLHHREHQTACRHADVRAFELR